MPAPAEFQENQTRELPLTPEEEMAVLLMARKTYSEANNLPLTPEEEMAVLLGARKTKYSEAYNTWYNWKTTHVEMPRSFTAEEIFAWFQKEAWKYLGKPFVLDDDNRHIVWLLCLYFAEDKRFETEYGWSLDKGLLLRGGVGCGKTTLLTIFSRNPRLPFVVTPCRKLVADYTEQGQPGQPTGGTNSLRVHTKLIKLLKGNEARNNYRTHAGLCLDDIGTEDWQAKHYGQQLNVVEHILCSRDDSVVAGNMPRYATHATTNVPFDDYNGPDGRSLPGLETIYGSRFRSRFRGLFNVISFPQSASDRRA